MAGRAGLAAIEIVLDIVSGEQKSGRTTVDDAADRRSVAFAKRGDGEDVTEGIAGHRRNGFYCEYLVGRISYLASERRFTKNASRLLQKVELDAQLL
jgi:hypothetical protein